MAKRLKKKSASNKTGHMSDKKAVPATILRRKKVKYEPMEDPSDKSHELKVFSMPPWDKVALDHAIRMAEEGRTQEFICEFLNAHGFRTSRMTEVKQASLSQFLIAKGVRMTPKKNYDKPRRNTGLQRPDSTESLPVPKLAAVPKQAEVAQVRVEAKPTANETVIMDLGGQIQFINSAPLPTDIKKAMINCLVQHTIK